jgi:hypothetical protein
MVKWVNPFRNTIFCVFTSVECHNPDVTRQEDKLSRRL